MTNWKTFTLNEDFIKQFKGKQPKWGPLGYVTYKRTYARIIENGKTKTEEFWQTCQRVVEGVYSVQKNHCKQNKLPWNERKAQRSAQKMFQLMWDLKFTPPGRGLWMMGTDYVMKRGGAALNNPLGLDTKVLTKEYGWITFAELETNEEITVLSNTKLYGRDKSLSAQPIWVKATVSHIETQPTKKLTFEDKFGLRTTIVASENHRWFKRRMKTDWERTTTNQLQIGDYIPLTKPSKNYKIAQVGIQHGFFFGDGTRSNGELHQFKDSVKILKKLFTNTENIDTEHSVVKQCPLAWGKVPLGFEYTNDNRYMYGFLAGYLAADGHVDKKGNVSISSSRLDELRQVETIFSTLGIRTLPIREQSYNSNFKEERELYNLGINPIDLDEQFFLKEEHLKRWKENYTKTRRDWAKLIKIEDNQEKEVRCVTVPNYEQFVINGFLLTSNCAFCSTENIDVDFAEPFCFLMDMSMLGVGVGADLKGAGKVTIKEPIKEGTYIVDDSREGWIDLLRTTLQAYFKREYRLPETIDYSQVRPFGTQIKGFGGTASGPEPLDEMVKDIQKLLNTRIGEKIKSTDIVDIFNMIGKCVVAGNVRRTAEIMFGNPNDTSFLELKDPDKQTDFWGKDQPENMHHRWASNNSIFAEVGMDYTEAADRTAKNGEPGYEWLENAQKYSRMGREADNKDYRAMGGNPCLEQTLEPYELCCLVETYPSRHETLEDYQNTIKYAYLYAKTVTLVPTHNPLTNAVMMRNRRIGCSMSGIVQAFKKFGRRQFLNFCDIGYNHIKELDKQYSDWLCIPRSIKMTSVKPSGTVSLLAGVTPGIHYPISQYYIRNVRFQKGSLLLDQLKQSGYKIEKDKYSPNTFVVSFPIEEKYFDRSVQEVSMWEQLEIAAQIQQYWADNQVSITVSFDKETEGPQIKHALELYETRLKGVSFLPKKDHGFVQAPYIPITKEEYEKEKAKIKKLKLTGDTHENEEKYCDGETCSVL